MDTMPPAASAALRRHDRPTPRYTSYPPAPQFDSRFGHDDFATAAAASNASGRPLSLYVHVPFCASPCFYCGCNRIVTRDRRQAERYLADLAQEIALIAPLFTTGREVVQLHLGGGTPNFLAPEQLAALVRTLGEHFHFSPRADRDFSIELDPRTVDAAAIATLATSGFNRASLGVQDFDADVQAAINRPQGVAETRAVVDACRDNGFRSLNIDLIYGLPKQTLQGFARTLDAVLAMAPDRLAIYSYAHMPALFPPQRQIRAADLPDADTRFALLQLAIRELTAAGYAYVGMDHFARPDDELALAQQAGRLHRNFMGYTTHADSDLIGFGVSAISHVDRSYSQNHRELGDWQAALGHGRQPLWRGVTLDRDDVLRADLIQQLMCQARVDIPALEARHGIRFHIYFREALARLSPLADDGLVQVGSDALVVSAEGRLLLRVIAACFDRYLHAAESRVVELRPRHVPLTRQRAGG